MYPAFFMLHAKPACFWPPAASSRPHLRPVCYGNRCSGATSRHHGKALCTAKCAWHNCCSDVLKHTHQQSKAALPPQEIGQQDIQRPCQQTFLAANCYSSPQTAGPALPRGSLDTPPTSSGVLASITSRSRASARYSSLRRLLLLILRSSSRRSLSLITRRGACSRPGSVTTCDRHQQGCRLSARRGWGLAAQGPARPHLFM